MKKTITLLVILFAFQMNAQCWQNVSAGINHTLGVKADGTLWAWGKNDKGQLGLGNIAITTKTTPTQIGIGTNWVYVSAGYSTSFAIKSDGTLWGWGSNEFSKIGDGTSTQRNAPVQIGTATNWLSIDSKNNTLAIKTDGTLWGWGFNSSGQLGDGTNIDKATPTQIGTATDWLTVSVGGSSTVALKTNGTLWACGNNYYGQLANGLSGASTSPPNPSINVFTQIGTATDWQKISIGNEHILAIKANGTLWVWGSNNKGQLGDGTLALKSSPTQIGTGTDWNKVSATTSHSLAVKTDGTLWGWGYNSYGQVGDGTTVDKTTPTQIGMGTTWSGVFSRAQLSVALKTDGSFSAWGYNASGQLGNGTTSNTNAPAAVACPTSFLSADDFSDVSTFSVYPNPANDFISIKNDMNLSIDTISIIDLTGKKVFEQKENTSSINVQQLESGLYIIQITSEGKNYQNKFIKR